MAEFGSKIIQELGPNVPGTSRRLSFVRGISVSNNDTFTCSNLTTIEGAFLISTTGVVGAMTFATNIITVTNGGALTWTGIAWGS